ncbi:thioredoxin family protein [Pseudogracilibacillus auburnensis]|uniref:Thioredoxin n=1 Tax=Pseudogracilibacillus auburnensis TaxID=1494959 RepID=A0A2V3VZL0_9BACI|nr:thioredoxin family protein [Pseudogracilibacillus auburnensis]PXW86374.1 thioredoxin [Pseudogracilibacillus auburnensis]
MTPFKPLSSIKETETFIHHHTFTFLYITQPNCSVCHGLQPQIERIIAKYPNIHARTIDASKVTEIAGLFSIFTAPVLLLFVNGKEYLREARIVQTELLDKKIARIYENMVD